MYYKQTKKITNKKLQTTIQNQRWIRAKTTVIMIAAFVLVLFLGHWAMVFAIVVMSVAGFSEIETLMRAKAQTQDLPISNRILTW